MADPGQEAFDIGPYRVIRRIGEGGKGRVYEAQQSAPVRRTVALKVLRSTAMSSDDTLRFRAEQQALAMMDHPGIAKVFDAGADAEGQQWLAMELVDGLPLVEFADRNRLDMAARAELFMRVCAAVQHAHQKGIIHRDLKPSNVLVAMEDGVPSPKVIDFGVAKAVGLRLTEETLLTQFGAIIGTPAYMSPEQAEGTVFDIDTRADVYGLGVMLYELLVGCLPVDPRSAGYPAFIAFLKDPQQEAPAPAQRYRQLPAETRQDLAASRRLNPAQVEAALSGDLRWILMTALEKEPARRYQSAGSLGDDLRRWVRGDAVHARPPSPGYVVRKFIARNRLAVAAASLVVLALTAGAVAATIGMIRAEREATVAREVAEFLENIFAEASPFTRSGEDVTARQLLDRAAQTIETGLSADPAVQARLMLRIGAAYRGLGLFDEATPLLERALQLNRDAGAPPLAIADAEYELGYHLIFISQWERSRELLQSAIDRYRQDAGYEDPRLAVALGDLVFNALRSSVGVRQAYELLEEEVAPAVAGLGPEHPAIGQLAYMRCWALRELGQRVEALAACRDSLALLRRIHDIDRPTLGHNTLALGHAHRALGQDLEALEIYDEALAINRRLYGPDHPEVAYTLMAMSTSRARLGDLEAALENARDGAEMMERVHGTGSTEYAMALGALASVLTRLHRYDEAESHYRAVLAIDTDTMGPDSRRVAMRKAAYAGMLLRQGRLEDSERLLSESLEVLFPATGAEDVSVVPVLLTASQLAHRLGRTDEAERYFQDARMRANRSPADYAVELASVDRLASCLAAAGDLADAACAD